MDAQPPDITALEPLVATNIWAEEDEARVDGNSSKEEQNKLHSSINEKLMYQKINVLR